MAFLDSAASAGDEAEAGPPPTPPEAGAGRPPGAPPGGGPVLAAIANRQRGPQVSAPGMGDTGNSIGMLTQAVGMMNQALPGLMGHPAYQDVLRSLQRLQKHLPQGQPALGVQKTQLQDMLQALAKNVVLANIMSRMKGGAAGAGGAGGPGLKPPPGPPPGAMAQAPMPSTPMPGA